MFDDEGKAAATTRGATPRPNKSTATEQFCPTPRHLLLRMHTVLSTLSRSVAAAARDSVALRPRRCDASRIQNKFILEKLFEQLSMTPTVRELALLAKMDGACEHEIYTDVTPEIAGGDASAVAIA